MFWNYLIFNQEQQEVSQDQVMERTNTENKLNKEPIIADEIMEQESKIC